jgi:hypothetical protein
MKPDPIARGGLTGIEAALSSERLARYLAWAAGDQAAALTLYTLNTQLSEALYTPLQVLELALRNRVHVVMAETHGVRWFDEKELLKVAHQRQQLRSALATLKKERKEPTPGRVVAGLTFSFWTAMLSPDYEDLGRATLNGIARKADGRGLARKDLSSRLNPIRILRNRVAHHEPVLHWDLRKHHGWIREVTEWLSPAAADWCAAVDRFPLVFPQDGYTLVCTADTGQDLALLTVP